MPRSSGQRQRARKACEPYRQRKRKCDGAEPCDTCTSYDYRCIYKPKSNKKQRQQQQCGNPVRLNSVLPACFPFAYTTEQTACSGTNDAVNAIAEASPATSRDSNVGNESAVTPSTMSFPHILEISLGVGDEPRAQSFAHTFDTRPDQEPEQSHPSLESFITQGELGHYSEIYFSDLAPIGNIIDASTFARRSAECFQNPESHRGRSFAPIAAGVAALGSFVSSPRHPRESELVRHAKIMLEDPDMTRKIDVDHLTAWTLRVVYLRATTRLDTVWLASFTLLHLCEIVGLHEDNTIQKLARSTPEPGDSG